jgi:heat shock protein HtpX
MAILAPIFATLIQLAISRKREFFANASGAPLTHYPECLALALQKTSNATAHLFIANPFGANKLKGLLSTHPRIEARISVLLGKKP